MGVKTKLGLYIAVFGVLGLVALLAIPSARQYALSSYSRYVLTNTERFLTCEQLVSVEKAEQILESNESLKQSVLAVGPNSVSVDLEKNQATKVGIDNWECPGRADVLIMVMGDEHHRQILELLGSDYAGIPYRIVNY